MGTLDLGQIGPLAHWAVVGLAGSGIGAALGVPMVWPSTRRSIDIRLMGGWLLALSAVVAIISARLMGLLPSTAGVNHAINLAGLAAYPLLYLYVREQTRASRGLRQFWWLWVPAAAYVALLIGRSALGMTTKVPFVWMLPVVLVFTGMCLALVLRREKAYTAALVPAEGIVAFLVVMNVAQIVRMLFGHVGLVPALVPLVATGGFVAMVGLIVWRSVESRPGAGVTAPVKRYEKSGLDREAAAALLDRIDRALSTDRLFADAGLTLGGLAAAVESTPHQVSEVLNRYASVTFHELLNRRRVSDVKAQLLDSANDRFTIEGIGASAGFGSRSALHAAFRRLEGVTPSEFRARRG